MQVRKRKAASAQGAERRGSAAVEFAVIAPVFVALFLGVVQQGYNIETSQKLYAALRQSGRLASMDYSKKLLTGQTGNSKVIQDIKNQLTANGLPGSKFTVTITHADGGNAGSTFDLSDPANDLGLFRITVSAPYSELNLNGLLPNTIDKLSASIVFRKGKSTLVN